MTKRLRIKTKKAWQRPTLPPKGSTIGAKGLNFRVRDGNGWNTFAIVTRQKLLTLQTIISAYIHKPVPVYRHFGM